MIAKLCLWALVTGLAFTGAVMLGRRARHTGAAGESEAHAPPAPVATGSANQAEAAEAAEAAIDPATITMAGGERPEQRSARLAVAIALYQQFVVQLALTPAEEERVRVAFFVAQDRRRREQVEAARSAVAELDHPGGLSDDFPVASRSAADPSADDGASGRPSAWRSLEERLRRLLGPERAQRALAHPFLPELERLDEPLFERR
jgi:hypothetical protein